MVFEQKDQTLPGRQLRQRAHYMRKQDSVVQRALDVGKLNRRQLILGVDLGQLTSRGAPTKEGRPLPIEEAIDGDSSNPRVKTGFLPERTDGLISLQPNFLREIFGVLRIVTIVQGKRMDSAFV